MNASQTFSADSAAFQGWAQGETVSLLVDRAAAAVTLEDVIVLRGGRNGAGELQTRAADGGGGTGGGRLEFALEVQVPISRYPDANGVAGAGRPTPGADVFKLEVRSGDSVKSSRKVTRILGQVNGMWHLGLE